MKNAGTLFILLSAMAVSIAAFSQAPGSPERWVSNTGTDTGTCLIAAPCRTFAYAAAETPVWGQLGVLNAGDYGPVTIGQSIKIDGGGLGTIQATSGNAITVNTPAGSVVQIANLGIHGNGAANGISFTSAGGLDVDHVQLTGFSGNGINFVTSSGLVDVVIRDTTIENIAGVGIYLDVAAGTAKIINTHVRLANGGIKSIANGTGPFLVVSVFNSTFFSPGNPATGSTVGIWSGSYLLLDNVEVSGFDYGAYSASGSIQIHRSSFFNNFTGFMAYAPVISNGDNIFYGNGTNGSFTSTVPMQ